MQAINSSDEKDGVEFRMNTVTTPTYNLSDFDIIMLDDGTYFGGYYAFQQTMGLVFDSSGIQQGAAFQVNTNVGGNKAKLAQLTNGNIRTIHPIRMAKKRYKLLLDLLG